MWGTCMCRRAKVFRLQFLFDHKRRITNTTTSKFDAVKNDAIENSTSNYKYNYWNKHTFGSIRRNKLGAKKQLKPSTESVAYYRDILDSASAHWTKEVARNEDAQLTVARLRHYRDTESIIADAKKDGELINVIASATLDLEGEGESRDYDSLVSTTKMVTPIKKKKEPSGLVKKDEGKLMKPVVVPKVTESDNSTTKPAETKKSKELELRRLREWQAKQEILMQPRLENPERPAFHRLKKKNCVVYEKPHRYDRLYQRENPCYLPSVSRILKETMSVESRTALQLWEERLVLQLGREGFKLFQKKMLGRGERLHERIEKYLISGDDDPQVHGEEGDEEDEEISQNHWKSIQPVLIHFSRPFALESHVAHSELGYQGYTDCVAVYKNTHLVLIDWKTSDKKKRDLRSTFDNPLQVAAYAGALNHDPKYDAQVLRGAIVVAYNDGSPADVLQVQEPQLAVSWRAWLKRLSEYRKAVAGSEAELKDRKT